MARPRMTAEERDLFWEAATQLRERRLLNPRRLELLPRYVRMLRRWYAMTHGGADGDPRTVARLDRQLLVMERDLGLPAGD